MSTASVLSWTAVAVLSAACGGGVGSPDDGGIENGVSSYDCPSDFQSLTVCTPPAGSLCVGQDPTLGCTLDALPSGLPCSGSAQCTLRILPCPNEVQTDSYLCTCLDSHWSCDDCAPGSARCAAVLDAAPIDAAPPDVTSNDEDGSDSAADSGTGTPGSAVCTPSTRYVAAEPCPSTNGEDPYTTFECAAYCLEFHSISNVSCKVGGSTDANVTPLTDADTIVLCCPGEWDGAALPCEPPFQ